MTKIYTESNEPSTSVSLLERVQHGDGDAWRMLARDPNERPASADEIAAKLENRATGHSLKRVIERYGKWSA